MGDKIILPEGMTPKKAIQWIQAFETEQNRQVAFTTNINAFPTDGAFALYRALKELYGFTSLKNKPGFFGDTPPLMIGVEVAEGEIIQVPWGQMGVPGVDGVIETSYSIKDKRFIFTLSGQVKRKHEHKMTEITDKVKEILREKSIYRGQAIRVKFAKDVEELLDSGGSPIDSDYTPRFMNFDGIDESQLILNEDTARLVDVNVFTPIKNTQACRENNIPLHRGVLMEGQYGTGKTLTATVLGKVCKDNKWTFIYLDNVEHLQAALEFAKDYQPAVVFAEDVDRVMGGNDRNSFMDGILNTVSGVNTKDYEIMMVLTTNHVEKINQAMLRPGRLDAVISIDAPDAESVQKLIRMYGGTSIPANADLSRAGELLSGSIPAVVREVVERSKLGAIQSSGSSIISGEDMEVAALGMSRQRDLLERSQPKKVTAAEAFGDGAFRALMKFVDSISYNSEGTRLLEWAGEKMPLDDGTLDREDDGARVQE